MGSTSIAVIFGPSNSVIVLTATRGDGPAALQYLKSAGEWTLGVAEKIGVGVAIEALKRAI